ncbi:MAG: ribose ABC transporter permease, partial [Saccharospirillum sp.]
MTQVKHMTDRFSSTVNRLGLDLTILAPLIALVVLLIASSLASEYFLNTRNLTNVMRQVSYTGIIAIG